MPCSAGSAASVLDSLLAMLSYDVVIIGGGHNALVAAAYLGRAGRSVLLLERSEHLGGAAVSAQAFPGVPAQLSRYSYLVSLLPAQIVTDLGLDISLVRRRISSYTPDPADPRRGLLLAADGGRSAFEQIGAGADHRSWGQFSDDLGHLAARLFPSVLAPLPTRAEARALVAQDRIWAEIFTEPIGAAITSRFSDDLVRGVVGTDALIGTFASLQEESLAANRCFLYHVIGGGTGDWDVPVGGMGAVTSAMTDAARGAGAELRTGAEVTGIDPDGQVGFRSGDSDQVVYGRYLLSGVAPAVLARLLGEGPGSEPEGAQVKVNLLLRRLPRLRDSEVAAESAFGGTFHINETYAHLESSWAEAAAGRIPDPLPCEIYCHSLSDPSILGPRLRAEGAQTLTVFGLHTPHRWAAEQDPAILRERLQAAVLGSIDSVLAEPIEDLIATDADGRPCIETKTTQDLAEALAMPGGHIFHGPLEWPFVEDGADLSSPAARWGVATAHPRVLMCGSGARRGGAVSGIGGHNAAMAALESLGG